MRRTLIILAVVASVLAIAGSAFAETDGVKNSPHNLSAVLGTGQTVTSDEAQICIFCHTPHNALLAVPLWNRENAGTTFTVYSGSDTLDGATDNVLTNTVSLMCLSCHDGATALNAYGNDVSSRGAMDEIAGKVSGGVLISDAALGTDLSDDHPINIVYDVTDTELYSVVEIKADGIDLFDGKVQCGSCHDVHNYGTGSQQPFLRVDNSASGLCVTCHKK